ncbi:hypothetical protein [Flavobacterium sp. 25HG05S-40]|uniref:hypothetical protein n=1 Tax=Flavobacterium sp. 25HG05S-40 TaxID=3458682 RepID=UPI004043BAA6
MGAIEQHFYKVKANLSADRASKELFDFIKSIESEIVQLNREQLNEKSKDIYGDAIGFYSKATEIITKGDKKAGEPFTAKDTGSFLEGLYAKVQNNMVVFGSSDPKTSIILNSENWLSSDLFGLTDLDLENLIDTKLKPFMIEYYQKQLLL